MSKSPEQPMQAIATLCRLFDQYYRDYDGKPRDSLTAEREALQARITPLLETLKTTPEGFCYQGYSAPIDGMLAKACTHTDIAMADFLLAHGANAACEPMMFSDAPLAPLNTMAKQAHHGDYRLLELMVKHKVNLDYAFSFHAFMSDEPEQLRMVIGEDHGAISPVQYAFLHDDAKLFHTLLSHGAQPAVPYAHAIDAEYFDIIRACNDSHSLKPAMQAPGPDGLAREFVDRIVLPHFLHETKPPKSQVELSPIAERLNADAFCETVLPFVKDALFAGKTPGQILRLGAAWEANNAPPYYSHQPLYKDTSWQPLFQQYKTGNGMQFTPLCTAEELQQEGRQMETCLTNRNYAKRCCESTPNDSTHILALHDFAPWDGESSPGERPNSHATLEVRCTTSPTLRGPIPPMRSVPIAGSQPQRYMHVLQFRGENDHLMTGQSERKALDEFCTAVEHGALHLNLDKVGETDHSKSARTNQPALFDRIGYKPGGRGMKDMFKQYYCGEGLLDEAYGTGLVDFDEHNQLIHYPRPMLHADMSCREWMASTGLRRICQSIARPLMEELYDQTTIDQIENHWQKQERGDLKNYMLRATMPEITLSDTPLLYPEKQATPDTRTSDIEAQGHATARDDGKSK